MRAIKATPRQSQLLDAICELGQTDLVVRKLGISAKGVENHIFRLMKENGYPNRLTLVLDWDRQRRAR